VGRHASALDCIDEATLLAPEWRWCEPAALATLDFAVRRRLIEPTAAGAEPTVACASGVALSAGQWMAFGRLLHAGNGTLQGLRPLIYHSKQLKCGVNRAQPVGLASPGH
jgi:hypothetical protein